VATVETDDAWIGVYHKKNRLILGCATVETGDEWIGLYHEKKRFI